MWHSSKVTPHKSHRLDKTAMDERRGEMGQLRELLHQGKRAIFEGV
jgi:hypothetical protein